MLVGALLELMQAVILAALGEHVYHLAAAGDNPVDGCSAIHETEHLDGVETTELVGIAAYHGDGILLALRYACGGYLDAVHLDVTQEKTCNAQFLVGQKTHSIGLLSVSESGVHNLYFCQLVCHSVIQYCAKVQKVSE